MNKKNKAVLTALFLITLFTAVSCDSTTQYNTNPSDLEATDISHAEIQTCPPFCDLSVTIDGDNILYYNDSDTYTADISGGDSPYTFLWNYTLLDCTGGDCTGAGTRQYGSSSSSFQFTNTYENFEKVRIEV